MDQAFVSLVDKEVLRSKLAQLFEVVKTHNKALEAAKLQAANATAEAVGRQAAATNQASNGHNFYYVLSIFS